jgi:pSer/pThr/pTyr-binding forkhead associated (FHA) protein
MHMAYGRLDIYWPDGRIESYLLEAPSISVGRAADNTIVLDTDTVSRHHFSITHTNNSTYLNDLESENGVIIDGMPLKSYEAHMLEDTEELQVGFLRIIYQPMDESVTVPMKASGEADTQRMRTNAEFSVKLDVDEIKVWPASSSSAELGITNRLQTARRFFITISGMPTEWIRVNRPEVEISPNDTTYVLINVKPPRRSDIKPADYNISIEVTPKDRSEGVLKTTLPVLLKGFGGFGMALSTKTVVAEEGFTVFLHNQGSEDLTLNLSGRSTDGAVALKFSMPRVTIAAGARSQVKVEVQALKRAWFGKTEAHKFTVVAQAQNASRFVAAIESSVTFKPRLPLWGAAGAALAVMLGLVAIVAILSGALTSRALTLNEVSAANDEVSVGEPITLRWQAANAENFKISVNQILVTEVAGDQRSVTIPSDEYAGSITIGVTGENGEQVVSQNIVVNVLVPLAINTFEVAPTALIRNVVTSLNIGWDAVGAEEVAISGLEGFTNAPIPTNLAPVGTLEGISGYPSDPINVVLTAKDANGNSVAQTVSLEVSDATCTATRDVALHDGPDIRFQQVSNVPANAIIAVVAQDQNSGWLRVGLPGDIAAWGPRDAFICSESFNLNDLRVEVNIPVLPSPSATMASPILVPTATLTPPATSVPATPAPATTGTPRA